MCKALCSISNITRNKTTKKGHQIDKNNDKLLAYFTGICNINNIFQEKGICKTLEARHII
jgi:hypothetical protein